MSCHDDMMMVPMAADADVYFVGGKVLSETGATGPGEPVVAELALNCEELRHAYGTSTAAREATFEEFHAAVLAEATLAFNDVYGAVRSLNALWQDNPPAQRALVIRVCVKWKWLRIYVTIRL